MKSKPIATMNDIFRDVVVFPASLHPAMIYRLRVSMGCIDFKFFDCKFNKKNPFPKIILLLY